MTANVIPNAKMRVISIDDGCQNRDATYAITGTAKNKAQRKRIFVSMNPPLRRFNQDEREV
jgi:hypothetical protein